MNRLIALFCLVFSFLLSFTLYSQQSDLYSSIYFPAKPYGGVKEVQNLVKQEMTYPTSARENTKEGSIFINFVVDPMGKVVQKEVVGEGDSALKEEALRIFDKILWETDDSRDMASLQLEKMRIDFNLKKYQRLVKKRGYDALPHGDYKIDNSATYYTINQVDRRPQIDGSTSINDFVSKNIKYPPIAYQRGISGRVTAEFIIEPYGLISNIRIVEAVAGGCNEETIRLLRAMNWIPAFKDDMAVRTLFQYQLNFVHPGGTVK